MKDRDTVLSALLRTGTNGFRYLWPAALTATLLLSGCGEQSSPVRPAGPVFEVEPDSLFFSVAVGLASSQDSLIVSNAGTDTLVFTARSDADWIIIEGTTPTRVFLRVSARNVSPGTHVGEVILESPNALNSPYRIPVTVAVRERILLSSAFVQFATLGRTTASLSDTVVVAAAGGSVLNVELTHGATWLSVTPSSGQTPLEVILTADISSLPSGLYVDSVRITSPDLPEYDRTLVVYLSLSSWETPATILGVADLQGVFFKNTDTGWVTAFIGNTAQNQGLILHTTDSGSTFPLEEAFDVRGGGVGGIVFLNDTTGLAVGDSALVARTIDGGRNWTVVPRSSLPVDSTINLWRVVRVDDSSAVACGIQGTIIRTADAGLTWSRRSSGTPFSLSAAWMADPYRGWMVGNHGVILVTEDGGLTWTHQTSGSIADLWGVSFTDMAHGWVVGDEGLLLSTEDGGLTWATRAPITEATLRAVFFVDSLYGWAVGDGGTVVHTRDGGATWLKQETPTENNLSDLFFLDRRIGWVVGRKGTLLRTFNGGF